MTRGLLPVEDDVEDSVEAVLTRQDAPELPLFDRERVRLLPGPVENSRDQALSTQRRATALPACSRGLTSSLIRSPAIPAGKCS